MSMLEGREAMIGRAALWTAVAGTALAPIHALSRFATEDGASDLDSGAVRAWAEPAADALRPILDWSDADTVYVTYGKGWVFVLLAATLCAFVVRGRRHATGAELWGWRIALTGYVIATASTVGDYWTPWLDESFVLLGIPGVLISLLGSLVLGIALLRRRFRPRATAWLLALWFPLFILLSDLIAMGAAVLPMAWAWALAGRTLAAETDPARVPVATERATSLG